MNLSHWEVEDGVMIRLNAQITANGKKLYIHIKDHNHLNCNVKKYITLLSLVGFVSPTDYLDRSVNEKNTLSRDKAVELAIEYARGHIRFRAKHLRDYYIAHGYIYYTTQKGKICKTGDMHHTPITVELVRRGVIEQAHSLNLESLIYEE